jgi:preprotein translocase subunit Sss1
MKQLVVEIGRINKTLEGILDIMRKPENKFFKALSIAGTGVGALGIIHVVDTVIKWFLGG